MNTDKAFRAVAVACALAATGAVAKTERTLMPIHDAAAITRTCEEGIAATRAAIARLEAKEGGEGFLAEWNALQVAMEDFAYPIYNLGSVHPDKAVRDASEPCLQKFSALGADLFQNEKLYRRLKAVEPRTGPERKLVKNLGEGFEDSGVALPPDKRARAKEIFTQLEKLRQDFERNVRDDKTLVKFTVAELAGLDAAFLERQKRDADGNILLGLDDPTYAKAMAVVASEPARQRYYVARANKGGLANLDILEQAYRLRKELAGLYGLPTYADFALRRKMVGKPEVVRKFLADVKGALTEVERQELAVLEAEKRKLSGDPAAKLARWDLGYLQERVRKERFAIDQEKYRKYFPTDKSLAFALLVAEKLYGVRFTEVPGIPTWHPDVRYFDMHDAKSGAFQAGIYVDLYARDGKRNGAWVAPVRRGSRLAGRKPYVVLVTNFSREGLNDRERETLLHEFGHAMHGMLGQAQYLVQSGTSVKRDFVEAPSQMFEEWIRHEQPLALMKQVCAECPQLTRDEIARMDAARRFGKAIAYSGQWTFATLDMELSTEPQPPLAVWKRIEGATPLGYFEGTWRPASFAHLASAGYAAGYYGYMWSEVIGLDLLSPFKKDMLDPAVGARFRDAILAQGGQDEEMNLVRNFLGRDPSSDAFFAHITGRK